MYYSFSTRFFLIFSIHSSSSIQEIFIILHIQIIQLNLFLVQYPRNLIFYLNLFHKGNTAAILILTNTKSFAKFFFVY